MKINLSIITILTLASVLVIPTYAAKQANKLNFNAKVNLESQVEVSYQGTSAKTTIENGVSLGMEYLTDKNYGFGVEYQIPRNDVSFIPMYFFVRSESGKAGVQGNVGYNLMNLSNAGDVKMNGGLYLACSAFVGINEDIKAVAEYSINNGSLDIYGENVNVTYPKVSFGISICLN